MQPGRQYMDGLNEITADPVYAQRKGPNFSLKSGPYVIRRRFGDTADV